MLLLVVRLLAQLWRVVGLFVNCLVSLISHESVYAISRLLDFPCYIFFPIVPIPFSPNLQYAFTCHLANQSAAAGSFGYTLSTLLCRYTLQAGSSNRPVG